MPPVAARNPRPLHPAAQRLQPRPQCALSSHPLSSTSSLTPPRSLPEGCFVDPNPARLLKHGLPGCAGASPGAQVVLPPSETCDGNKMTPQLCAEGCYAGMRAQAEASGGVVLAGPENGNECFCDVVPEWSGKAWDSSRPLTPSKLCTKPCAGGKGDVSLCAPDPSRWLRPAALAAELLSDAVFVPGR